MATYRVTDPNTGRTIKLTGDAPPTEAELNDIFSSVSAESQNTQGKNRLNQFRELPQGLISKAEESAGEFIGEKVKGLSERFPKTFDALGDVATAASLANEKFKSSLSPNSLMSNAFFATSEMAKEVGQYLETELKKRGRNPTAAEAAGRFIRFAPDMLAMGPPAAPAIGAGAKVIGKTAQAGAKASRRVGSAATKKGIRALIGVPEDAQVRRFYRNAQVRNAPSFESIADTFGNQINNMRVQIQKAVKDFPTFNEVGKEFSKNLNQLNTSLGDFSNDVWKQLEGLNAFPRSKIIRIINEAKKQVRGELGVAVGATDKKALGTLDGILNDVKGFKQKNIPKMAGDTKKLEQFLNQKQLKSLIDKISKNINWEAAENTEANIRLMGIRKNINEALLNDNPNLVQPLRELQTRIQLVDEASQSFVKNRDIGGFIPGDNTAQKLRNLRNQSKVLSRENLEKFKEVTGFDFDEMADRAAFRESIEKGQIPPREVRRIDPETFRKSRIAKSIEKNFGFAQDEPGGSVIPTNRTQSAMKSLSQEGRFPARRILTEFEKEAGSGIGETIKDRAALDLFSSELPKTGMRGVLPMMGAVAGLVADPILPGGGAVSSLLGTATGTALNTFGGQASGSLIDLLSKIGRSPVGRLTR